MTGHGRSPACRNGTPGQRHGCTGCGCECHAVTAPANFRDLVTRQRDRHRTDHHDDEQQDGGVA